VAAGNATITYTVAGTGGCANATATRSVTIEALPAAALVTVTQPTCIVSTGTITITSPTGTGYTYSINGGTYQASVNFINLTAGSYVVRVKNSAGCVGATTTTATINTQPATPSTPGTISGSATVNSGTSQTYSVQTVSGATSYSWTLPNGWVGASVTNSITVQTSATGGTISVVANANGCTSAASTLAVAINTVVDSDGDGILDTEEGTGDVDGDGIPNYLDLDSDNDGIPDSVEGTDDADGDGIPNYLDFDSDGDGIPDALEGTTDSDGDGIPNYLDLDSDNDGIPDSIEDAGCNGTAPCTPTDSDNDGIPNYLDLDSDNDGIPDSVEDAGCNGTAPCTPTDSDNDGIPNYLDLDSDNDGIPDSIEDAGCNGTAPCTPTDSDNDGIPNYLDLDSDNDGIPDSIEDAGCNGTAPCTPTDSDNDGIPNYLDLDSDNDGIPDSIEDAGCNGTAPCTPTDSDNDGIPNYLDLDSDNDGIPDSVEDAGCNGTAPCTPTDSDNDGIPNYLDLDSDNDGIPDSVEDAGCNGTAPCTPTDTDNDGIPNYLDLDSDNDGIPDSVEDAGCNGTAPCTPTDTDNDGIPNYLDLDSDNDGIPDSVEDAGCNGTAPCTPTDTDGDGIPNYLDLDSDNDGIPDSVEDAGCNGTAPCTPTDTDGDGIPNYLDLDSDNDGILDAVEDNGCNGVAPCTPTDTDGDGIPNYLDVDSDGDGCSDANEAYNSLTAQGTDGNMYYGNGNPPAVNSNGQVVGATYPAPGTNYITAGAAPVITGDPASLTTSVGAVVNFSATASVTVGTVSYQWQVSTNGGTSWTNIALLAPYSGVTNSVLNINGVTAAMQGNRYRVIAYQAGFICGADTSAFATLTVNFPPDAVNDVVTVAEDVAITGNLLTNDTDPNGDPLTVVSFVVGGYTYYPGTTATIPGVGTILINANGTYTFTPEPNFNGVVPPITYTISDGQGGTDTANLLITITAVNDAPDAQNDSQTTLEDTPAIGNVLTNDTDIDGNPLTVTQFVIGGITYPAGITANIVGVGTLVINGDGTFTYTPTANYNGPVPPVTYTVSDGQGGTDTAILQISITPVNDAPVAQNDNGTTQEDQPLTGNVLTNDTDVDGNPLTVTQIVIGGISYPAGTTATIPGVGTLVVNPNGTYTFTPAPNFNGTVPPVQYFISDGQGGTASATLQIFVQSVADPEDIQIATTPVCISGTVTLQASTSTVANPVFKWYADATLTNLLFTGATYVTPTISSSTNYYVTVSGTGVLPNQPGNAKVATATILPAPARPTITAMGPLVFCKDDSVVLKVSAAASYQWYKDGVAIAGATTDTYVAKTEGDYTVVITNTNGCSSAPSNPAVVRVPCTKGIHMPTIFTPNGDGKNDVVKPSIPGMKKFECFKVYNRWGNLVFENYKELRAWDGTFKGVNQPAETYIWVVQGFDGQGKPMRETGMITLTR
jgi:gliding motility-associated-like protein